MTVFDYIKTAKYKNYLRNKAIFDEKSSGVFRAEVSSRVKMELMGSGAIVQGSTVFTGVENGRASFTGIGSLIVPANLLSSVTSAYITYSANGGILFNNKESDYLTEKVKAMIREQSIGGSCLIKKVMKEMKIRCKLAIGNKKEMIKKTDEHINLLMVEWDNEVQYCKKNKTKLVYNSNDRNFNNVICNFETENGLWQTLQSMRNVESSALLKPLKGVKRNDEK